MFFSEHLATYAKAPSAMHIGKPNSNRRTLNFRKPWLTHPTIDDSLVCSGIVHESVENQNCQIPRLVNLSHTGKSAGVGSSSGTIILSPSVWQLRRLHTSTKPLNAYAPNQHTRKPNDIHIWRVFSGRCSPMMSVHLAQLESFQWIACTKTMRHWFRPLGGSYVTKILGQVWDQSFVQQKSWCIAIYSATKILMHTATTIEQN